MVMSILDKYNSESTVAHRQRLVWKLSNRTLRHLRPTDKLRATLPTINESGNNKMQNRTSSESSGEFDSLSLSLEENFEDDSEINMEQPLQNGSENCEVDINVSYVESSDDVESASTENSNSEEEEIEVANECVNDMDVEY